GGWRADGPGGSRGGDAAPVAAAFQRAGPMLRVRTPGHTTVPPRCHEIPPHARARTSLHRMIEWLCDYSSPDLELPRGKLRREQAVQLRVVRCPMHHQLQARSSDRTPGSSSSGHLEEFRFSNCRAVYRNDRTASLPLAVHQCPCSLREAAPIRCIVCPSKKREQQYFLAGHASIAERWTSPLP